MNEREASLDALAAGIGTMELREALQEKLLGYLQAFHKHPSVYWCYGFELAHATLVIRDFAPAPPD